MPLGLEYIVRLSLKAALGLLAVMGMVGCNGSSPPAPASSTSGVAAVPAPADEPLGFTFTDVAKTAKISFQQNNGAFGAAFMPETFGSGAVWFDYDNDSDADLFFVNGRNWTTKEVNAYEERPLLFLNTTATQGKAGQPKFREIAEDVGLKEPIVARGLCVADYDLDGDADVLMTTTAGAPRLWRNDNTTRNNTLRLTLRGKAPNLAAIGAKVEARTGSTYLSQNEMPLTLGVGKAAKIDTLSIRWPDGTQTQLKDVATNQIITIEQSKGLVGRKAFTKKAM